EGVITNITIVTNLTGGLDVTNTFVNMCPRLFSVTRTWRAIDSCSNSALCSQTFTIVDDLPPNLVCGPDKEVECGTDWTFDPPTAVDKCGTNVVMIFTNALGVSDVTNTFTGMCPKLSSVTRTWIAIDSCSNVAFCNQTVTIVDTTPPNLVCA